MSSITDRTVAAKAIIKFYVHNKHAGELDNEVTWRSIETEIEAEMHTLRACGLVL